MRSFVLVLAIATVGCGLNYEPDVGPALGTPGEVPGEDAGVAPPGCEDVDSDPAVVVSFALNVRPLMTRAPGGCMPCHLGRITSGLDLSSYQSLRRGGNNSAGRVVVPNEPCSSVLLGKIGRTPPFGSRMPFNGPPYFSAEEQRLVADWIAEGAQNN